MTILSKVSFDKQLYERELRKAFRFLPINEYKELVDWCVKNFEGALQQITREVALEKIPVTR